MFLRYRAFVLGIDLSVVQQPAISLNSARCIQGTCGVLRSSLLLLHMYGLLEDTRAQAARTEAQLAVRHAHFARSLATGLVGPHYVIRKDDRPYCPP